MIDIRRHGGGWVLTTEQRFPRRVEEVWPFFSDARNLEAITPPYLRFEITTPGEIDMHAGTRIDYRLKLHGVPFKWRTEITAWEPPHRFVDDQVKGPYVKWTHEHRFIDQGDGTTLATDRVEYRLPGGPLAPLAHALLVRRDVHGVFAFRREKLAERFDGESRGDATSRPASASPDTTPDTRTPTPASSPTA